jgi:hypothetical protein
VKTVLSFIPLILLGCNIQFYECHWIEQEWNPPVLQPGECWGVMAPAGGYFAQYDACGDEYQNGHCYIEEYGYPSYKYYVNDLSVRPPFYKQIPCHSSINSCEDMEYYFFTHQSY